MICLPKAGIGSFPRAPVEGPVRRIDRSSSDAAFLKNVARRIENDYPFHSYVIREIADRLCPAS